MAPEQIRGANQVDARADVFSLGVVLFECLAGRRPYDDGDVLSLFTAISAGRHASLAEAAPELDADLVELVERSLDSDPARRPADAEALEAALAVQAARPAEPTRGAADGDRAGGRRPGVLVLLLLVLLLLGLGLWQASERGLIGLELDPPVPAERAPDPAPASP